MNKYRLLDGKDMDKMREPCNFFWPRIEAVVNKCFGDLATLVWGNLQKDELIMENFVDDFNIRKDKNYLKRTIESTGTLSEDIHLINFAQERKVSVHLQHVLESFSSFNVKRWIEEGNDVEISFLGDRGSGKTTFIMYLLKNLPDDVIIFSDNLHCIKEKDQVDTEIYLSLITQIDRKVKEIGKNEGLDNRAILNKRFFEELEDLDAIIEPDDEEYIKIEKEKKRTSFINENAKYKDKHSRACLKYLRTGIDFLKSFNKRICITFDDIDRLTNLAAAEKIQEEANEISETLNVPVIISLREITVRKMGDRSRQTIPYHIVQPSFRDIVEKRFLSFKQKLHEYEPESITVNQREYGIDEYIKFVRVNIDSILTKKENLLMFYMLSNSNLELMLDFLKSLLSSSHLDQNDIKKIVSGKYITQHKILETLLLYIYRDHHKENTFLINLYDCGDRKPMNVLNNLFRIRFLQIVREYGIIYKYRKTITVDRIKHYLDRLGYSRAMDFYFEDLISKYSSFSVIGTSILGTNYTDDTEIFLLDSAYYYLDYLIYTYRYMQTVIPDCHLDYEVDIMKLKGDLKVLDGEIERFIKFIERCEKEEAKNVREMPILNKINSREKISVNMRRGYEDDRERQRSKHRRMF
jgi:GTPase SAR1 family protein